MSWYDELGSLFTGGDVGVGESGDWLENLFGNQDFGFDSPVDYGNFDNFQLQPLMDQYTPDRTLMNYGVDDSLLNRIPEMGSGVDFSLLNRSNLPSMGGGSQTRTQGQVGSGIGQGLTGLLGAGASGLNALLRGGGGIGSYGTNGQGIMGQLGSGLGGLLGLDGQAAQSFLPAMAMAAQQWKQAQDYQNQSEKYAAQVDPFGSQRAQYQKQLSDLYADPSSIANTPGYKFAMDQGIDALSHANAAKGYLGSGKMNKDIVDYSSGLASKTYNDEVNRLMQLSGSQFGPSNAAGLLQSGLNNKMQSQNAALGAMMYPFGQQTKQPTIINNNAGGTSSGYPQQGFLGSLPGYLTGNTETGSLDQNGNQQSGDLRDYDPNFYGGNFTDLVGGNNFNRNQRTPLAGYNETGSLDQNGNQQSGDLRDYDPNFYGGNFTDLVGGNNFNRNQRTPLAGYNDTFGGP